MRLAKRLRQRRDQRIRRRLCVAHEVTKQLAADELGAGGLLEQNTRDVIPVPCAAVLQDGLDPVVMLARHLLELVADNEPAGERPRGLLDVFLACNGRGPA